MSEGSGIALPKCAADYIDLVTKKVRYRRKVRAEVRQELTDHFADALRLAIISRAIVAVGALTSLHENTENTIQAVRALYCKNRWHLRNSHL
jgi:hypothetical protein